MRTVVIAVSVTLVGILGGDLGRIKPSWANPHVKHPGHPAPSQLSPLPSPATMPGVMPGANLGNGAGPTAPETSLCFLQRADGSVINLNQLCAGTGTVRMPVIDDPGAERARQMEWHGGY